MSRKLLSGVLGARRKGRPIEPKNLYDGAESARGVSPRAAHRSGLDTLASSGSCHRTKAAASRRELELLLLPVGSLPTSVTCPLRSTGITRFSTTTEQSAPARRIGTF